MHNLRKLSLGLSVVVIAAVLAMPLSVSYAGGGGGLLSVILTVAVAIALPYVAPEIAATFGTTEMAVTTETALELSAGYTSELAASDLVWSEALNSYAVITTNPFNPISLLTFGSGPRAGEQSDYQQTQQNQGATCYGPVNSCGQAYQGTWSCYGGDSGAPTWYLYKSSPIGLQNNFNFINRAKAQQANCTCVGADGEKLTAAPPESGCAPAPPTCSSFSPSPDRITQGNSSNLNWSCSGANSCTIDNGVGSVSQSGSASVSPSTTTTYTLSCNNSGGSNSYSATVTVDEKPVCAFSASPSSIIIPQSANLAWTCTKAVSCSINRGIGGVNNQGGSVTVSPTSTMTYTLSCNGTGNANASFDAKVRVGSTTIQEF